MTATSNEQLLRDVREHIIDELSSFMSMNCSMPAGHSGPCVLADDADDRAHVAKLEALLNRLNIAIGDKP